MSAVDLDAVKRKYNFKTVSIATWRDPSQSVLPARGGPSSPSFPPDSLGRPYHPTYRVKYDQLTEHTDDDDCAIEKEDEATSNEEPADILEVDETVHVEAVEAQDPDATTAEQEQKIDESEVLLPEEPATTEAEAVLEEPSAPTEDLPPDTQEISQPEPEGLSEPATEASVLATEPADVEPESNLENGDCTLAEDAIDAPVEDSQPQAASDDIMLPTEPVGVVDPELSDGPQSEEHGDQSDERRVSFAPGTPEPKPTSRKKKIPKGTKGKKKRNAVPMNEIPADILAMIDSSLGGPPPPAPEPPAETDTPSAGDVDVGVEVPAEGDTSRNPPVAEEQAEDPSPGLDPDPDQSSAEPLEKEVSSLDDDQTEGPKPGEQPAVDEPLPAEAETSDAVAETTILPQPIQENETPLDLPAATEEVGSAVVAEAPKEDSTFTFSAPPVTEEAALEKPSKKRSSKSSKDKSKKSGSKSKSKQSSSPPAGLGIDTGASTIPDIDDLLKDIPAPDGHVAAPPEEPSAELEAPNEDSKDVEAVGEEQAPPSAHEADASVDGNGENPSETQHETDAEIESNDKASPENPMDQRSADKEAPNTADADVEAKMAKEGQSAADEPTTGNPASSPADSGVEFEDIEKIIEADDGSHLIEDHSTEGPGVDELKESTDGPESSPIENEVPAGEKTEGADSEPNANEEAADSKGAPLNEEDGDTSELKPEDLADDQLPAESEPAVDTEAPVEPPSEETAERVVEAEITEPNADPEQDGSLEDAAQEETTHADDETPQSLDPESKELDVSQEDDSPNEPDQAEDKVESDPPESGSVVEDATALEPNGVSEEPSTLEKEPVLEVVEPAPPEAEAVVEEVVPEEPKFVDEEVVDDGPAPEESAPADDEPSADAPPSPNLSKTSSSGSRKHKTDHWERKHTDNALKGAFEDSVVLQKSKKSGKEEIRVKDRARRSRHTSSAEEDEARRRRRALRREEEAKRAVEEEQRKLEEDKARRIRRDERRAARKAEEEVEEKIKRLNEEKESIRRQREDEARRRRHRERDREAPSPRKEAKDPGPALKLPSMTLPKALGLANGQSYHGKTTRHGEEAAAPTPSKHKDGASSPELPKESSKEAARPSSSSGSKSHHRRHHSHRSEGEHSSKSHGASEHRSRRSPKVEEDPPKTLFGLLRRR